MLNPKSLKRILEHQEKRKLIEEGFIEHDNPFPEQIELTRIYESRGNYHNEIIVYSEKYSQKR